MPKSVFISLFAICACCIFTAQARADTQLGIEAIALSGTHFEPKQDVSTSGFAGFIQLDETWKSVQLHLEGIPSVGTATVSTRRGPAQVTLGWFNASARFRLDPVGRFWFGGGTQVLAQRTPQVNASLIDSSRLAGSRYELFGDLPVSVRADRFIEMDLAAMPHLSGIEYTTRTTPVFERFSASAAETAGMTDLSLAYAIARGRVDYLVGGRAINFAAKYASGREADRNVGAGIFATVRLRL